MRDVAVLSLTAALTWGMWRALGAWGAMGMAWALRPSAIEVKP